MESCVVVQCFCKLKETITTLRSLERCIGVNEYNLLLYVDRTPRADNKNAIHSVLSEMVHSNALLIDRLAEYKRESEHLYKSIEIVVSETNLGPYVACFNAIELAFASNEFVVFSEDDIIFCKDSLTYYNSYRDRKIDYDDNCIGITTSSRGFFPNRNIYAEKSGEIKISPEHQDKVNEMKSMVIDNNLANAIERVKWAPNKQMGLFAAGWNKIKKFRGEEIHRCVEEAPDTCTGHYIRDSPHYFFVYSIVPRSNDVGLFHELGCTTLHYVGDPGYSTIKYLTSDDFECNSNSYQYVGNWDALNTVI